MDRKISYEEFASKLKDKSVLELRKIFNAYGIEVPASTGNDKDQLLRIAHEQFTGKQLLSGPAPVPHVPAAPTSESAPKATGAGRRFKVRARVDNEKETRWRAGHKFGSAWQEIWESNFSSREWDAIRADKVLQVVEIK